MSKQRTCIIKPAHPTYITEPFQCYLDEFTLFVPVFFCPHVSSPPLSVCSLMETELTSLCQSVLEDFNLVLFYLPPPTHGGAHHSPSEEEEEQQQHADSSCPVLPDTLVFKMVVTCLMVVHSLKRGGQ